MSEQSTVIDLAPLKDDFETSDSEKKRSTLRWTDLSYTVTDKTKTDKAILRSVSGVARSGEMVAVMGGSGSGKTTLLNILSGRFAEGTLDGVITFNSKPREHKQWPWLYGFVEQLDCFFGDLTVAETLDYSASFKLKGASAEERRKRVDDVMQQLGLTVCKDVIVGNPERFSKGISTGQKKRLAIAVSMLNHPEILFLDEPTSGLDSFTAMNVVQYLRAITTREEQICIMSIHQPRENILALFDKLIILSQGQVVFTGTVDEAQQHFSKLGFPTPNKVNPSDFWLDIVTPDHRTDELEKESTERIEKFAAAWHGSDGKKGMSRMATGASQIKNVAADLETSLALDPFTEYMVLLKLSWTLLVRDKLLIGVRVSGAVATLLVFSVIFWRLETEKLNGITNFFGFMFFYLCSISFLSGTVPIPVFLENRLTIKRERAAFMYRASTMFFARFTVWGIFHALFAVIDGLIYWGTVGVQNPGHFMLAGMQFSMYFVICALAVGALIPHMGAAVILMAVSMILPASMFSGAFDSVNKLIPWTKYLDPEQYTMCMIGQGWFGPDFPLPVELVPGVMAKTNPDACYVKYYWGNFGLGFIFWILALACGVWCLHNGTRTKHRLM
ncbi:P-loop containing nucleoside triphosphate hydrolase protein [Gonapodya prolifera JEL478]|uniref:p-loop containing nucleoside triphosphate hydrolase protein n=1 Tax=Gonapodya prolifera (strain JEL478) TaxID=1344416 RepID=A0A139A063_GONPJ|nr:P-loop containing nucleoside triphosphate hydrolase protein [Gonapodya prolifera JEL478]|eukprot:KXS10149.1 P-loop containing nucleoside triphosphate hydrolase protein [Gonapodya prolifera JEL478]